MSEQAAVFLTAEWRELAMLNFEVDPAVLAPLVPAGTVVDSWNGRTFVSVVGFMFLRTRVLGIPIPLHRDFEELNLRFYVRRDGAEGPKRGVVFVKEIVPKPAIAWVARVAYNENYVAYPMRHDVALPASGSASRGHACYEWRVGGEWNRASVEIAGEPFIPARGSEEEFITEHYWGYAGQRDGSSLEYQVEHPQWRVWRGVSAELRCDAARLYGSGFAPYLEGAASSAFVAEGSEIVVRRGRPLRS
jgi:uncharacterized protein YqjF (DUF2071 family)